MVRMTNRGVRPKFYCPSAVTRREQMEKNPSNRAGNKSSVDLGRKLKSLKFPRPFKRIYSLEWRLERCTDNNNMFVAASRISLISSFTAIFVSRVKRFRTEFIFFVPPTQLEPHTHTHTHREH